MRKTNDPHEYEAVKICQSYHKLNNNNLNTHPLCSYSAWICFIRKIGNVTIILGWKGIFKMILVFREWLCMLLQLDRNLSDNFLRQRMTSRFLHAALYDREAKLRHFRWSFTSNMLQCKLTVYFTQQTIPRRSENEFHLMPPELMSSSDGGVCIPQV